LPTPAFTRRQYKKNRSIGLRSQCPLSIGQLKEAQKDKRVEKEVKNGMWRIEEQTGDPDALSGFVETHY